jgi:bacillopeptidase F (M6 metalloprotease family)
VVLRNDKSGTLADVQPGHHVTVTYEIPKDKPTAREIAQTSSAFTGDLTAVDLTDRTLKAKSASGSKKFHVADGCVIALRGKADAELRDLKPGDKLTFSYNDVNGVNVAIRVASATESSETATTEPH